MIRIIFTAEFLQGMEGNSPLNFSSSLANSALKFLPWKLTAEFWPSSGELHLWNTEIHLWISFYLFTYFEPGHKNKVQGYILLAHWPQMKNTCWNFAKRQENFTYKTWKFHDESNFWNCSQENSALNFISSLVKHGSKRN